MDPEEAATFYRRTASTLMGHLLKTTAPGPRLSLFYCITSMADRMDPKEAAEVYRKVADTLAKDLAKPTWENNRHTIASLLGQVAASPEPKSAAAALVQCLGGIVAQLEPEVPRLGDENDYTDDSLDAIYVLAEGLSAVTATDGPEGGRRVAERAAAAFAEALSKYASPNSLDRLTDCLSMLLSHEGSSFHRRQLATSGARLAGMPNPWLFLAVPAQLQPLPALSTPPLPPGLLVDLLKYPFCVGKTRQLVLGATRPALRAAVQGPVGLRPLRRRTTPRP